jgi:hypothetical protein
VGGEGREAGLLSIEVLVVHALEDGFGDDEIEGCGDFDVRALAFVDYDAMAC